jgi:acetyl esterase
MPPKLQLEPEAIQFAKATANPPYLFDLGPAKARQVVDDVQSERVEKPAVRIEEKTALGPDGGISLRIVRPPDVSTPLPVIVYFHGGGWVVGSAQSHDRLVRELAVGARAAVVFVSYSLSPEARHPVAVEECYAAVKWAVENAADNKFDASRLFVAGDSAGGCLAAVVTLLAKQRGGPRIAKQVLFYPVTNAAFDTASYHEFATGYFLRRDAMMWFWDQYAPDTGARAQITASPLRASTEQLHGLPPALVITAEADVLRDEGEAYANRLREAGVRVTGVRFQGTIHDFVLLNALAGTTAARGAIALATGWLAGPP